METRILGRTQRPVSVIGLGTWQLGADWGDVREQDALAVLEAAHEAGVRFFDTADVYGDGRSESLIGSFMAAGGRDDVMVATKAGRRAPEQSREFYTLDRLREWTDRSRANLGVQTLDLLQLHCPPSPVFTDDAVYDALDTLVDEKRIAHYGFSVETREQALAAIARPRVASVQIILNMFRMAPLSDVLPAAREAGVGIIARVPLASGLLSGKYDQNTTFAADDHRTYNRHGSAFDVGETFSGVDFEIGLRAVAGIAPLVPEGATMAQFALRWIVDQPGVTTVIPGARTPEQARANAAAADLAPIDVETRAAIAEVYDELIKPQVADRW